MPKHGWKWRTDQVRKLTELELIEMLDVSSNRRVSSRMARFIYENCIPKPDVFNLKARALDRIGWNEDSPWGRSFLWRELEKLKGEPLGDWCVIALARGSLPDPKSAIRFIELYEDQSTHPHTRGSAIFGINSSIECADLPSDKFSEDLLVRIRKTCLDALTDQDNAYARAKFGPFPTPTYLSWCRIKLVRLIYSPTQKISFLEMIRYVQKHQAPFQLRPASHRR